MFSVPFLAILAVAVLQCESQKISGSRFGKPMELNDRSHNRIMGESRIQSALQNQRMALNDLKRRVRHLERSLKIIGRKYGSMEDGDLCDDGDLRCKYKDDYSKQDLASLGSMKLEPPPFMASHKQHCAVICVDVCDNGSPSSFTFDGIGARELAAKHKRSITDSCKKCRTKCTHMDESDQSDRKYTHRNPLNRRKPNRKGSRYLDLPMYDMSGDYYDTPMWNFNDMFFNY